MKSPPKILIIDDDPFFTRLAGLLAQREGMEVEVCNDSSTLDYSALAGFELILLDISMPGLDGIQILNLLASHAPETEVIFMTAIEEPNLANVRNLAETLGIHVRGTLNKPFDGKLFRALLGTKAPRPRLAANDELNRMRNLDEIAVAISQAQFYVLLQPQIALAQGRWLGCEALARWKFGPGQIINPANFIPVVEQSDLALEFTLTIARLAMCDMLELEGRTGLSLSLAINIPAAVLNEADFVERLLALAASSAYPPSNLILEITEWGCLHKGAAYYTNISRMKLHGIRISIDDVGTGYSALTRIKDKNCDEFKLERSFIMDMKVSKADREIVKSLLDLGKRLNISCVAEGIEDAATCEWLRDHGCQIGQGNYLGRPQTLEELLVWHEQRSKQQAPVADAVLP